ncbi:LAMI_0H04104g1_1 [Lachancea mirantina]|uniref:LAMI_0H04104g1_1 n=1 Tax=Lachancea mirantina TaxID=1230905 RepID=A0A1G4KEN6_9SACH|nr:LAMI_0H04104g1_1 [Lachancea mirantina]
MAGVKETDTLLEDVTRLKNESEQRKLESQQLEIRCRRLIGEDSVPAVADHTDCDLESDSSFCDDVSPNPFAMAGNKRAGANLVSDLKSSAVEMSALVNSLFDRSFEAELGRRNRLLDLQERELELKAKREHSEFELRAKREHSEFELRAKREHSEFELRAKREQLELDTKRLTTVLSVVKEYVAVFGNEPKLAGILLQALENYVRNG